MPSLSSLFTAHGPLLVADAASARVQVGLLRPDVAPLWHHADAEAGNALFSQTTDLLAAASLRLDQIGAFLFCEGPGSMLGIRTVAMALRTWQTLHARPAYAYSSLTLAAHLSRAANPGTAFTVIADARRESWHSLTVSAAGLPGDLQRLASADLPAGALLTPEHFRRWSQPPRPLLTCSYDLATIFGALAHEDYFRPVVAPDAFQHTAPDYKKWSAQIHQAAPAAP